MLALFGLSGYHSALSKEVGGGERERERERDRQTDGQTDRQTDGWRDRQSLPG